MGIVDRAKAKRIVHGRECVRLSPVMVDRRRHPRASLCVPQRVEDTHDAGVEKTCIAVDVGALKMLQQQRQVVLKEAMADEDDRCGLRCKQR